MNNLGNLEKKKLAATAYVLGWTRSTLADVLNGDYSREQAQRICDASATHRIAESIGLTEADWHVDFELLSETEKHKLQGYEPG
ncbi:MAG: hypothetical protein C5B50_23625 [Verrucomicrobia bacterium]|nr:MAG: hypothetical protein C5B50_23625 [Verrucomicrobiota bacterium]